MRTDDTQIRVFVSYAQHSDRHSDAVLALAQALRGHGIAVELDRFHGHELIDWPRWCLEQLAADQARWVLMICSAVYRDRLENRVDPHTGKGVFWEGALIDDELYESKGNRRIVAVLLHDEPDSAIPTLVRGYALALEQAGAFVGRERSALADYLARWRRNDRRVQGWHDAWLMDYPRPLATTWQTSAEILPESARALLDTIAWLGSEPLPRFLFCETGEDEGSAGRIARRAQALSVLLAAQSPDAPLDLEESLARLAELPLLQAAPADFDSPGRLHRVLALMIRAAQTPERAAARAAALALADTAAVGDHPADVRNWPVWVPLAPHLGALLADERDGAGGVESRLLSALGVLLDAQARYAEAEPLKRRALTIDERVRGPEHPRVAIHLNNLARLLQATNRLAEAEPPMRRALAILLQSTAATGHRLPHLNAAQANYAALLTALGLAPADSAARIARICMEPGVAPAPLPSPAAAPAGSAGYWPGCDSPPEAPGTFRFASR